MAPSERYTVRAPRLSSFLVQRSPWACCRARDERGGSKRRRRRIREERLVRRSPAIRLCLAREAACGGGGALADRSRLDSSVSGIPHKHMLTVLILMLVGVDSEHEMRRKVAWRRKVNTSHRIVPSGHLIAQEIPAVAGASRTNLSTSRHTTNSNGSQRFARLLEH